MCAGGGEGTFILHKFSLIKIFCTNYYFMCYICFFWQVPGKISQVDLMVKDENGEMKLAYEELVDMNLITLQRS